MSLKREIKDAFIEGGNSIYVKTHSNAVYVDDNETETLTQRLDNLKNSIKEHTTQLNGKMNKTDFYINALDIGCKTDGSDNSDILNNYFREGNKKGLYFPSGNYSVSKTIETLGNVIMDSNAYFVAMNEMDCVCSVNKNLVSSMFGGNGFILGQPKNQILIINVDCNLLGKIGIQTQSLHWANLDLTVKNPVDVGVYTTTANNLGCAENEYNIKVLYSNHTGTTNNSLGVQIGSNDDIFNNIIIINNKFGVFLNAGDCYIKNIHHWLQNEYNWSGSWTLKTTSVKNHIDQLTVDTVETGIIWDEPTAGVLNLNIDFYFAMINFNNVSNEVSQTFKVWNFSNSTDESKAVLNASTLLINSYTGQDASTSGVLKCGNDGVCPANTIINYVADYLEPKWQYDLNYAPQGTFGLNPLKYKNLNIPSSLINNDNIILVTTNTSSGKIQRILMPKGANYVGNTQFDNVNDPSSIKSGTYNYYYERVYNKWGSKVAKWSKYSSISIEDAYLGE